MGLFSRQTALARRVLLTIGGALILAMFLGLALLAHSPQASASGTLAVYLEPANTPSALRLNVAAGLLEANKVTVVSGVDQLQAAVAANRPQAIWINESALTAVPQPWLRQQLRGGVVIVGINATRRSLANALGISVDEAANQSGAAAVRVPVQQGRSVTSDPVWDWRHPNKPTFVIYYAADVPVVNSAGQRTVVRNEGSFNEVYEPTQPTSLFFFVHEAIQRAHQATGR